MTVRIRCVRPLVVNLAEGVQLSRVGEEADIAALTHFWQGQIERGAVEVISSPPPTPAIPEPAPTSEWRYPSAEPEREPEPTPIVRRRGRRPKK